MANKLIGKAIYGRVQLARYISTPMTLRYGTQDQVIIHHFHIDEMRYFSCQVNGQLLEDLKGVLYSYKSTLKFS